jgi:hypothetical protein
MHGHDVGVWVCEGSGLSLSPCLFMQAVYPDPPPRPLFVKWKQSAALPKSFQRSGALPLIYSECGRIPPWPYHLHLFASQAPSTRSFEQESGLSDWSFTVPLIGIIVIFDQKYDRPPATWSLNQLFNRSKTPKPSRTLDWVRAQRLPFVVAMLGYDAAPAAEQQFRSRYELAADIPIVRGPTLADNRPRDAETSSMFSSVFEHQKLAFDREYAKTVLGTLYQLNEKNQQTP